MPRRTRGAKNRSMSKRARRTRKRVARRKQLRNRVSVPVGLGFPRRMVMTHKYNTLVSLNTGALGVTGFQQFRCNGMFDPDFTLSGHQPLYFDQMSVVYNHYTVIGSKITIRATKTDASNQIPTTVGVYIDDDGTVVSTNLNTLIEQSQSRYKFVTQERDAIFTMKWSAKKQFGGSILGNDNLQGTTTSDPNEQSFFTVFANSEQLVTSTSIQLWADIEYIAVWSELRPVAGS